MNLKMKTSKDIDKRNIPGFIGLDKKGLGLVI